MGNNYSKGGEVAGVSHDLLVRSISYTNLAQTAPTNLQSSTGNRIAPRRHALSADSCSYPSIANLDISDISREENALIEKEQNCDVAAFKESSAIASDIESQNKISPTENVDKSFDTAFSDNSSISSAIHEYENIENVTTSQEKTSEYASNNKPPVPSPPRPFSRSSRFGKPEGKDVKDAVTMGRDEVDQDSDSDPYEVFPEEGCQLRAQEMVEHSWRQSACEERETMEEEQYEDPPSPLSLDSSSWNKRNSSLSIDSAYSDKSTVSVSSIEYMVEVYEKRIVESIQVEEVLPYISCLDEDKKVRIDAISKSDPIKAMKKLLRCFKDIQTPGKWQNFVDALKHSEYQQFAQLLTRECELTNDEQINLIRILTPHLVDRLFSNELIDKLFERGVISEYDKELIFCEEKYKGPKRAASLVLKRIHTRLPNWFDEFMLVCKECQLEDVIDMFYNKGQRPQALQVHDEEDDKPSNHPAIPHSKYTRGAAKSLSLPPPPLPPLPDRHHLQDATQPKDVEDKPPLPNTLPPKGKPTIYPTSQSPYTGKSMFRRSSPNIAYGHALDEMGPRKSNLQRRQKDHVALLQDKKRKLQAKYEQEMLKKILRKDIESLQYKLDELSASEYVGHEIEVASHESMPIPTTHVTNVQDNTQGNHAYDKKDVGNDSYQSSHLAHLHARVECLETHTRTKNEKRDAMLLSRKINVLEQNLLEEQNDNKNTDDYDSVDEEGNKLPTKTSAGQRPSDTESDTDPGYDHPDGEIAKMSNNPVPPGILEELSKMKEELKSHLSEEIKRLHPENLYYGYTDGYRSMHQLEQMKIYSVKQDWRDSLSSSGHISYNPLLMDIVPFDGYENGNQIKDTSL